MRKLASIQRILELRPIEGKDRIELARVLGWHVIVQKGLYKVGDLCVYVEIDSQLPERPEFEFLRPKKFRIKTMKMSGVVSEGICFPLDILQGTILLAGSVHIQEGEDVTSALGVKKYDPYEQEEKECEPKQAEISSHALRVMMNIPGLRSIAKIVIKRNYNAAKKAQAFPSFIQKTDETRIQNMPFILEGDDTYECHEKVDGSSMTVFIVRGKKKFWQRDVKHEIGVCSRNRRLIEGTKNAENYYKVFYKYNMEKVLNSILTDNDWAVIQGELIGPGIQGNKYQLGDVDFYAFNYITSKGGKIPSSIATPWLENMGIKWVPKVENIQMPATVEDVLKFATDKSKINPATLREGVVCRNYEKGVSFKAVSPEFLIHYGI